MTMTKPTSEQVTFLAAGSGASQRTVLDKLRDVVSVKDFGAVGDGVADDTAALQSAHNASKSVFYPAGYTFRIITAITIQDGGCAIGDGFESRVYLSVDNQNAFETGSNCIVERLHIIGPATAVRPAGTGVSQKNCGIAAIGKYNVKVNECWIEGFTFAGIANFNSDDVSVIGNTIWRTYYDLESGDGYQDSSADILFYTGTGQSRHIIENNRCLGDSSTGIAFSTNGGLSTVTICENIVDCLDPVTRQPKIAPYGVFFTASISGTTLTVSAINGGRNGGTHQLGVGSRIHGVGIPVDTKIIALGTGSGGIGTYTLNTSLALGSMSMNGGVNSPSNINRRHGILMNYIGGSTSGRVVVANNICQNTLVSGIYTINASANTNSIFCIGNLCRNNGQFYAWGASDSTLSGGIVLRNAGNAFSATGNTVETYKGDGNAWGFPSTCAAIVISAYSGSLTSGTASFVSGNNINGSTACGILLVNQLYRHEISNNNITGVEYFDIGLFGNTGGSSTLDIVIESNNIRKSNDQWSAIWCDPFGVTNRVRIVGNQIWGFSTSDSRPTYRYYAFAIVLRQATIVASVENNHIENFYGGIATINTQSRSRWGALKIDNNTFGDITFGICINGVNANSRVPVFGNRFLGNVIGNKYTSGGVVHTNDAALSSVTTANDSRVCFESASIPTAGEYVVGDRSMNSSPVVGSPKSWVCTVAGTPGTWVSEGNL